VKDVRVDLDTVREICSAYRRICKTGQFDFKLDGVICRSENIHCTQMFAFPDEIKPKFHVLLEAILRFTKEIASIGLNETELNSFLATFFEHQAYMARSQRVIVQVKSEMLVTDGRAITALVTLLESNMQEAIDSVVVTITPEMLEEKRRDMDAGSNIRAT
jgi:hypothetical protein